MSNVIGIVSVFAVVVLATVTAASTSIGSNSYLSRGSSALVVRPLFFDIGSEFSTARFLL